MLIINRLDYGENQTLGHLLAFDQLTKIYEAKSLELPWKENTQRISCIPAGNYAVKKHNSPNFGYCFWIQNVPGRSEILIHRGNFYTDILGCILIGDSFTDINNDGYLDVRNSANTVNHLVSLMPENFMIQIYGEH